MSRLVIRHGPRSRALSKQLQLLSLDRDYGAMRGCLNPPVHNAGLNLLALVEGA